MADTSEPRLVRNPAVTETTLDDEVFLVEPASGEVFYLNAVTSGLWKLFAEPSTEPEALETYRAAFPEAPGDDVSRDVAAAIADMRTRDLLVTYPGD
ncbi:MAG: PqqD family protein [Alphaproteobacteria bacterium]|nr:PqqD family protein [Alphaproteobacteria bacterium]